MTLQQVSLQRASLQWGWVDGQAASSRGRERPPPLTVRTTLVLSPSGATLKRGETTVTETDRDRQDIPQPSEDPDTGSSGTTDPSSSDNRREGLKREPDDKLGDAEDE